MGGEVHPVALGVQLEIRKHRRVCVQPGDLRLEHFRAGDPHQPPATAELQHAGLRGETALVEIVEQDPTGRPDLVPMERGLDRRLAVSVAPPDGWGLIRTHKVMSRKVKQQSGAELLRSRVSSWYV